MKIYRRKIDGAFPIYQLEVDRFGPKKYEYVKDLTPKYDLKYQNIGAWSDVYYVDGELCAHQEIHDILDDDLEKLIDQEWLNVRGSRDALIRDVEWMVFDHSPMTDDEKLVVLDYIQKLRDIPSDFDNPFDVVFPERTF